MFAIVMYLVCRELGPQRSRVPVTYMEQTHQTNVFSVVNMYLPWTVT